MNERIDNPDEANVAARTRSAPDDRDLQILEIIERSPDVTQRGIAKEMRIALGLANSCLKRMARKGWVKARDAPGRRLFYYLTPTGMSEKTRLTYHYVRRSVHFYGDARERCRRLFGEIVKRDTGHRVAFLGKTELSEIAYLSLLEFPLEFAGIYDGDGQSRAFFGVEARPLSDLAEAGDDYDVLLYTRLEPPDGAPDLEGLSFEVLF